MKNKTNRINKIIKIKKKPVQLISNIKTMMKSPEQLIKRMKKRQDNIK